MVKKLLKYDLKFLFKYWWIAAVTSLVLSFAGAYAADVLFSNSGLVEEYIFSYLFLMFAIFSISLLTLYPTVVSFIRFYKNMFSDEGYLTFTLPVKISQIINSKIISSFLLQFSSITVAIISYLILFFPAYVDNLKEILPNILNNFTIVLELIIIYAFISLFSVMFMFICITFGSTITKKAKVISSIGIYYGVNSIFGLSMQLFSYIALPGLVSFFETNSSINPSIVINLLLITAIIFIAMVCAIMYLIQYSMLDRKLNLA